MLVVQLDARKHIFQLRNRTHDVGAFGGVRLHDVEFFRRQRAGLFQNTVINADLADVMQQRSDAQLIQIIGWQFHFLGNDAGIFRHAPRVTTRIRILFVDGGRKHADGADKQFAIFFGGFLQPFDIFFDIVGHQVEVFSQFADFRGAAHGSALMKFTAADRAGGCSQSTNWVC